MKYIYHFIIILFFTNNLVGQQDLSRDAIKAFCGCFKVDFRYTETFATDQDYKKHPAYHTGALELVVLDEEQEKRLVLQHILVIDDSFFIKHWRQDWEYEPNDLFTFLGNSTWQSWRPDRKYVEDAWSQKVFEVDDAPRYSGSARWNGVDGKPTWRNTSDAPLPRREYTKRSDYQILRRTNTLIIEDWGWIHEQDNKKVAIDDGMEKIIVEEKGRNTYTRVDPNECHAAQVWWENERVNWDLVREDWEHYLEKSKSFKIVKKNEDTYMSESLEKVFRGPLLSSSGERKRAINNVLNNYRKEIEPVNP